MSGERRPPRTADGDAFRFRAGRPSLDLCSTLLWRYTTPVEQLHRPADLARWLREAGLHAAPGNVSDADLGAARALREAIYVVVHDRIAGRGLTPGAVSTVNALAAHPDPAPCLTADGRLGFAADAPTGAALARVARDAIEVLTDPPAQRLRECAAPDGAILFLDTSRPGQRRWCAMNRCGNRQHVREHRQRHR